MRCPLPSRPFPDPRTCKRATHASKHRQTATAWGHHAISGKEGGARESKGEQEREREVPRGFFHLSVLSDEEGGGWARVETRRAAGGGRFQFQLLFGNCVIAAAGYSRVGHLPAGSGRMPTRTEMQSQRVKGCQRTHWRPGRKEEGWTDRKIEAG